MIGWLFFGLIIYFTYSIKHSKVQKLPADASGRLMRGMNGANGLPRGRPFCLNPV